MRPRKLGALKDFLILKGAFRRDMFEIEKSKLIPSEIINN